MTARTASSDADATHVARRRLLRSGGVAFVAVVGFGGALTTTLPRIDAVLWTVVSALVVAGVWAYTVAHVAENRAADAAGSTYDSVGVPTGVTLLRATVLAGVAGVAAVAAVTVVGDVWAWAAAVGYGVAAALDSLDGALARRLGRTTVLGARLDTAVDAFGLLIAPLAGVFLGELPWWYLSVGVARYVFVAGIWWRTRTGRPTFELPPRASRRVLAGVQMAFVPIAVAPGVGDSWVPALAGVAAVALLVGFVRDWLYVSGRLDPEWRGRSSFPADSEN